MRLVRIPLLAACFLGLSFAARPAPAQTPDSTVLGVSLYREGGTPPPHTLLEIVYEHRWHPSADRLPAWADLYESMARRAQARGADMIVELVSGTEDPWIEDGHARWLLGIAAVSPGDPEDPRDHCDNCFVVWRDVDTGNANPDDPDSLGIFERQAYLISRLRLGERGYYLWTAGPSGAGVFPYGALPDSLRLDNLTLAQQVTRGSGERDAAVLENVTLESRLTWRASGEDAWNRSVSMTVADPGFDYVSGADGIAVRNMLANSFENLALRGPTPDSDGDGILDSRDREFNTPEGAEVDRFGVAYDDDGDGVPNGIDRDPNTPQDLRPVDQWGVPLDGDHDGVPDAHDRCPDTPVEYAVDRAGCPCEILADELVGVLLNEGVLRERFHFELDSAELSPQAEARLDTIGVSLSGLPDLRFVIEGHCDDQGDDAYNDRLSELRARSALDYLVANFPGLTPDQFTAVGHGKRRPLAESTDKASRALNRRVEFRVVNPEEAMRKVKVKRFRLRGEGGGGCGDPR